MKRLSESILSSRLLRINTHGDAIAITSMVFSLFLFILLFSLLFSFKIILGPLLVILDLYKPMQPDSLGNPAAKLRLFSHLLAEKVHNRSNACFFLYDLGFCRSYCARFRSCVPCSLQSAPTLCLPDNRKGGRRCHLPPPLYIVLTCLCFFVPHPRSGSLACEETPVTPHSNQFFLPFS